MNPDDFPSATPGAEVVLMCGVAGSGKTTYSKRLEQQGYERLSVDEEIWRRFGRYGIDYPASDYGELSIVVEAALRERLQELLAEQGRRVVIDFSFWQRAERGRYKRLVEQAGGTWRLVYLRVDRDELRRRLNHRNSRVDANAAFPITEEILQRYLNDFEPPEGEGEEVVS